MAIVFGIINAFVRPILSFLSMPIQFITLGIFALVLNAFMLMLTSRVASSLGLNFMVSGPDKKEPADVAKQWLTEQGLLK